MKAQDFLRKAKAMITDPANWTEGYYATDSEGSFTGYEHPNACKFCAMGAMYRSMVGLPLGADRVEIERAWEALVEAAKKRGGNIVAVNDSVGHAGVLAMFDDAISAAEAA